MLSYIISPWHIAGMPTNRQISSHLLMVESCSNLLKSPFHGTCTNPKTKEGLGSSVHRETWRPQNGGCGRPTPLVHVLLKPHGAKMRSSPSSFDCIVLLHVVSWNLLAPAVAMQVFHMNSSANATQRESDSAAGYREYHELDAVHRVWREELKNEKLCLPSEGKLWTPQGSHPRS